MEKFTNEPEVSGKANDVIGEQNSVDMKLKRNQTVAQRQSWRVLSDRKSPEAVMDKPQQLWTVGNSVAQSVQERTKI